MLEKETEQLVTALAERLKDLPFVHVVRMHMPMANIKGVTLASSIRKLTDDPAVDQLEKHVRTKLERAGLDGYQVTKYVIGIHGIWTSIPSMPKVIRYGEYMVYPHHPMAANERYYSKR